MNISEMTLEDLRNQLGFITIEIGNAETQEERVVIENNYSEIIAEITDQIYLLEHGTT